MITVKQPLSNIQVELMKIYSTNLSEIELKDLKSLLALFYAKKSILYANKIWKEKKLTNRMMDKWLNEN